MSVGWRPDWVVVAGPACCGRRPGSSRTRGTCIVEWSSRCAPSNVVAIPVTFAGMATVMFCPPHADDEVLQMGVEILRHLTAGFHVIVAAGSRSSMTSALALFDGSAAVCGWHHVQHPHYLDTPDDMSVVRLAEQVSACEQLGVHEFEHGTADDGTLTVAYWRTFLLDRESRLAAGDSLFVPTPWETTSGVGNTDHGNAGVALQQLISEGHFVGVNCRFTVFSRYWSTAGCPTGVTRGPANDSEKYRLLAAADCYRAFNPSAGSYGIGWQHSVPSDFNAGFVSGMSTARYLTHRYHS